MDSTGESSRFSGTSIKVESEITVAILQKMLQFRRCSFSLISVANAIEDAYVRANDLGDAYVYVLILRDIHAPLFPSTPHMHMRSCPMQVLRLKTLSTTAAVDDARTARGPFPGFMSRETLGACKIWGALGESFLASAGKIRDWNPRSSRVYVGKASLSGVRGTFKWVRSVALCLGYKCANLASVKVSDTL